jgi:Txe/YoeB family toxin of Txe-Axe toxin-antitoxin module
MVRVANQTVQNYIESLDENTKKEFFELIKEDSESLESRFNLLKEKTLQKLSPVLEKETDKETKQKIQETIEKIQNDKFNQLNFLRLKKLEESI